MRNDFVLPDEYSTLHATIEDALSHRTGMPGHDLSWFHKNVSIESGVQSFRHLPLTAELRTRWQYCNLMFITVSYLVESWTGKWLGDFLKTRIYEPLNMTSTFFSLKDARESEASGGNPLATGYLWSNYTQTNYEVPWMDAPQVSGAGATISNVLDYTKWLRCHMTKSAPLSPAGHDALRTPRMISAGLHNETTGFRGADSYALGWMESNYRGETMIWHTGGLPGFLTVMLYFPRLQWGLTMMVNGGDARALVVPFMRLLDDMMGVPEEDRYDVGKEQTLRLKDAFETLKNARELLYPNAPRGKATIPLSLTLESYAGVSLA